MEWTNLDLPLTMEPGTQLRVLSFTKESSFNLRDAGSHVPDRPRVVGMLFCIGLLTVGSRLCVFCSLHFRTLRDHCRATTWNISDILNSATSSLRSSSRAFASLLIYKESSFKMCKPSCHLGATCTNLSYRHPEFISNYG